jgi:hypothetical protein
MYDFPDDPSADPGDGSLTRISAGPLGNGDCNSPNGGSSQVAAARYISEDGSRVYFACSAPLPGVAASTNGTMTEQGGTSTTSNQVNLYVYDSNQPNAERWSFIARLPRGSGMSSCATTGVERGVAFRGGAFGEIGLGSGNCFRGTASGDFVMFFTDGRLIGSDPAAPTGDIYAYDLVTDELIRVTAPQGGTGPVAPCGTGSAASLACYGDPGDGGSATTLPSLNVPTDPVGPAERVVYFHSRTQLVANDIDTSHDVYEWHDGELTLLTTGDSDRGGAFYYGNDRNGRNVYFGTRDILSWQDFDSVGDVYTARIGGGIEQPVLPPPCDVLADLCQGSVSTPPAPAGASTAVFSGEGNLVEKPNSRKCPKGKVRRGNRCAPKKCGLGKVRRGKRCVKRNQKNGRAQRTANTTGRASR